MTLHPDTPPSPDHRPRKSLLRRVIRIVGFAAICLITLMLLGIAVENWRGKRAWERYRKELEAQGERLDLAAFVPKPVAPDDNFCAAEWFGRVRTNATPQINLELGSGGAPAPSAGGTFERGTFEDLHGWREFYRGNTNYPQADASLSDAEAVLVALGKYDAILTGLREASHRPDAVLPLEYRDPIQLSSELMPLLAQFKGLTRLFRFHACAELAAGHPDEALQDLGVCFRIEEALANDPLLISQLVRMAVVQITIQPVWEGLATHSWAEPELAQLQNRLASIDFLTSYQETMRGERAYGNAIRKVYRDSKPGRADGDQGGASVDAVMRLFNLAPKGWLYQNEVACNQLFQEAVFPVISPSEHRIDLDRQQALERWSDERGGGPYTLMARLLSPAISRTALKFAHSQAVVDQAIVACALERYRLAEGKYPERLDALKPRFMKALPPDVINGEPLHYRRNPDGGFLLYSVGSNNVDDEGILGLGETGNVHYDQGDWIWRQPGP